MKPKLLNFPFSNWQFIGTAIVGYVAFTVAYGMGWHHLPWDGDIAWNKKLFGAYSKHVLYALEFITITAVLLFAVTFKNSVGDSLDRSIGRSAKTEKTIMLAAIILILAHAAISARTEWATLSQDYKSWWLLVAVRYFYALFCCCVIALWLRLTRGLFDLYYSSLQQDLKAIQETPQKVFNVGRRLARSYCQLLCSENLY